MITLSGRRAAIVQIRWRNGSVIWGMSAKFHPSPTKIRYIRMTQPPHIYQFILGAAPARPPLVLLHGSGGDERELVPLAEELAPGSPILGLRGTVAIDGGYAFFHRFP